MTGWTLCTMSVHKKHSEFIQEFIHSLRSLSLIIPKRIPPRRRRQCGSWRCIFPPFLRRQTDSHADRLPAGEGSIASELPMVFVGDDDAKSVRVVRKVLLFHCDTEEATQPENSSSVVTLPIYTSFTSACTV